MSAVSMARSEYFLCPPRRREGALVRESGMGRQLPHSYVLQAPIALDAERPSSVIRFRMLQAIIASASCDFG